MSSACALWDMMMTAAAAVSNNNSGGNGGSVIEKPRDMFMVHDFGAIKNEIRIRTHNRKKQ